MGPITLSLGLACAVAALSPALLRGRRRDLHDGYAIIALVYVWAVGASAQMITELLPPTMPPIFSFFGPPVDLAFGGLMIVFHRRRPTQWKRLMVMIAAGQLIAHALYGLSPMDREATNAYKFALNVSFLTQLALAATPGALYGIGRIFNRLPRGPRALGIRK